MLNAELCHIGCVVKSLPSESRLRIDLNGPARATQLARELLGTPAAVSTTQLFSTGHHRRLFQ